MTDEVIPFAKPKPEQLTLEQFKALSADDQARAIQGGHVDQLQKHGPRWRPEPTPTPPTTDQFRDLARDWLDWLDKAGK